MGISVGFWLRRCTRFYTVTYTVSKNRARMINWLCQRNFTKTGQISIIFGRKVRYTIAYWLRVKNVIHVENQLCSFHSNSRSSAHYVHLADVKQVGDGFSYSVEGGLHWTDFVVSRWTEGTTVMCCCLRSSDHASCDPSASGGSWRKSSTVEQARFAGALSCWKLTNNPPDDTSQEAC